MLVLLMAGVAVAAPVPEKPAKVTFKAEVRVISASSGFFARPDVEKIFGEGGASLTQRQLTDVLESLQGDADTNHMQAPVRDVTDRRALACEWTGVGVEASADGKTFALTRKAGKARVKVEGDLAEGASLAVRVPADEAGKGRMAVAIVTVTALRRP